MVTYTVGQRVWQYNVNDRSGPRECRVEKVGRKLVTVSDVQFPTWRHEVYRIEDGVINDRYGHSHIVTDVQRAEQDRRGAALRVLADRRLIPQAGCHLTLAELEAIAAVLAPCPSCERIKSGEDPHAPRHDGSARCESGSIASGGHIAHCTCDTCF